MGEAKRTTAKHRAIAADYGARMYAQGHSQLMWAEPDVIGLFSGNVVPFSLNVGRSGRIFSANVVPKRAM